jgi:hypothetical protein
VARQRAKTGVGVVVGMEQGGDRHRAPAGGEGLPALRERKRRSTRLPVPVLRRCNSPPIPKAGPRLEEASRRVFRQQLMLTGTGR